MPTLARLSFWVSPEQMDAFEATYEKQIVPMLKQHDLEGSSELGRRTVEGVFDRLFEVETPSDVAVKQSTLERDPGWQEVLQSLGTTFGTSEADDLLPAHLGVYRTPAGPGRVVEAGPGFRQGLWQSYSVSDGLPSSTVNDILQDREGNLWFGTRWGGVCRYDGAQLFIFTEEDGLAHNTVHCMLEDREGHLWFGTGDLHGTGGGVSRYDGETFVTFTREDGLAHHVPSCMLEDREGHLWFGTGEARGTFGVGVSRYDGEAFRTFTPEDGLVHDNIITMLEDRKEYLWFGTYGGGMSRYDGEAFKTFTTEDGLVSDYVATILEDREGHLWVGSGGGVSRYDGEAFTHFAPEAAPPFHCLRHLLENREGHIWFGMLPGGVSRYDGKRFTTFTTEDGLGNDQVLSLLEDREGHLWVGTLGGGVSRYDGAQFTHFTVEDGLIDSGVMCLLEDDDGSLWFGTWYGACRYGGREFVPLEHLRGETVECLLKDREGHLWIGTQRGGVGRYDGKELRGFTRQDGLAGDTVRCILEDREGNLWFGCGGVERGAGVSRYTGDRFVASVPGDELTGNPVSCMLEDREGNLWFGTDGGGVSRYDGDQFVAFTTEDGLASDQVATILEDGEGNLWFGTIGGGVSRYDGDRFVTFTTEDGLVANHVWSLLEDRDGHLWIGTYGGGVSRYDGRVFQSLARRDGLVHDATHEIHQDRNGDIWITSDGGVTRYHPQHTPPTVYFKDVVADRRYGSVEEIHVSGEQNLVVFEFQGRSLTTPPDRMAYVYMLEGQDPDWTPNYTGRVEYQDLPLGEYVFRVQAVDRDLNYSEPVRVRIIVEPDPRLEALTEALSEAGPAGEFVGKSAALRRVQQQLAQVASTNATVLILGETGTGKGLAARTLHELSPRADGPFVPVHCGAIPEGLVESELFGHEKGAFTGAESRKLGKVELADEGTLFLDEIGDMALETQVKLLHLLEERTFDRVGGTETLSADIRIVAATNRDLRGMVEKGTFREDLYYRLQGFRIRVPPLRERKEDIPMLAVYFMQPVADHVDKEVSRLTPEALLLLQSHDWRGNVRELKNTIERAVIVCPESEIRARDIALGAEETAGKTAEKLMTLKEYERWYIRSMLEQAGWVIKGPEGAAALLDMPASTLHSRMKKLGIERP